MFEALALVSFWVWALIALEVVLLFIFVENENGIAASISAVVFVCLLQFVFKIDVFGHCLESPTKMIALLLAFILIGVAWGCIEWRWWCKDEYQKTYVAERVSFLEKNDVKNVTEKTEVPSLLKPEWKIQVDKTKNHRTGRTIADPPRIRDNKGRWIRWAALWPIGVVWSGIDNFVFRVWNTIYNSMAGFLQNIANATFASAASDFDDTSSEIPNEE